MANLLEQLKALLADRYGIERSAWHREPTQGRLRWILSTQR
jgi:hypothetical protein